MSFSRLGLAAALIALAAPVHAQQRPAAPVADASANPADAQLRALYEEDWEVRQREWGRVRDADGNWTQGDALPSVAPEAQARRLAHAERMRAALEAVPLDALSPEERINAEVFRTNLDHAIANQRFRAFEKPVNSDSNFWSGLNPRQPFRTAEEYRRYLARMRDLPRYFDEQVENMRAGLARGFTPPRVTLAGREESIAAFTAAQDNPFLAAFDDMPARIPAAERAALRAEAETLVAEAIVPAYTYLLAFFRDTYVPGARETLAATDLPDGQAFYDAQVREFTTLELTAREIHDIGLAEVARIQQEMEAVMRDAGFTGTRADFIRFLRTDPQFYAETPDELLAFSAYVAKRVDGRIGDLIGHLPRRTFTILPVPDAIAPFYTAGRGGLGSCLMNTYNLPTRPLYNIPALTLHECAPGHSFQAALALEQEERPDFRRSTYFSGYGEGWGLYTEWLGVEMGIYRTPYEHFGRLSYEMWRAARLVIDTGIHQFGWSRAQAIDYLAGNTALSTHEVETEVDRYISWPAQALSYKLGEITIRRLRGEAEEALGERFDPRHFHDAILALGSVPLTVLEERIARFIADGGRNPDAPCRC